MPDRAFQLTVFGSSLSRLALLERVEIYYTRHGEGAVLLFRGDGVGMGLGFRWEDGLLWLAMRDEKVPAVHILASKRHGTLYIGVTSDLCSRIAAHKDGNIPGFTKKYSVKTLVWYEYRGSMEDAIRREKQLKEWHCGWKIELIEKLNPIWRDLFEELCGSQTTLVTPAKAAAP